MAKITGQTVGGKSPSLQVDEAVLEGIIAKEKREAVALAKEDFSRGHDEQERPLTPQAVHQRAQVQLQSTLQHMHNPHHNEGAGLGVFLTVAAALAAAYFLFVRAGSAAYCYELVLLDAGAGEGSAARCFELLQPALLEVLPAALSTVALPLVADVLRRRKTCLAACFALVPRLLLFLVTLHLAIRALVQFKLYW